MFLSGLQGNALFEEIEDGLSEDVLETQTLPVSAIALWANSCS